MSWLFILLGLIFIAALAFADYKWRQWIATRRRDRDTPPNP
jgi:hypothetical protein